MKTILKQKYAIIALVCYSLLLAYWMLIGFNRYGYANYMYNLMPFSTIKQYMQYKNYNFNTWIINLLGNIGVFIPFGILIPLAFRRRFLKSIIIFEAGLLVLEIAQLVTKKGSFDIDDFILNTIGFLLGYGLYIFIIRIPLVNKAKHY